MCCVFFFKQKTAYEMRISDWSSDVCSSDLIDTARAQFDTVVQDPSLPDPVRQRFDRLVRNFDKQIAGGGTDISGFADASIGWDSNINAATDLSQITIPLFAGLRSEEHTSELQSLMRISYAVFCLKKKTQNNQSQ